MANDSFTTVTRESWFGRIGNSFGGAVFGLIIFLLSFVLLFWNEGRAVKRAQALDVGSKQVVSIAPSPVLPEHEGKLVHVTGEMGTTAPVEDDVTGLTLDAILLRRDVEMYQWTEHSESKTEEKLGGSKETTTTTSYRKEWQSSLVRSEDFAQPEGHRNPSRFPLDTTTFAASEVLLGDFVVSDALVDLMNDFQAVPMKKADAEKASRATGERLLLSDGALYLGEDPRSPQVGDVRISYSAVMPGVTSVVAGQEGEVLRPFALPKLGVIAMVTPGNVTAEAMFEAERQGNALLTWLLRLAGFVFMTMGFNLMISPLATFAAVVPLFGRIAQSGIGFISLAVAAPLTLTTIGIAWLAYRPLLGIPLVLAAVGVFVWAVWRRKPAPALEKPSAS